MTAWSKEELRKIAAADDLHISPFREDAVAYGTPTWICSVAVEDALYARTCKGRNARWHKAAARQNAGRIITTAMTKDVLFEPIENPLNEAIDDAYRAKYHDSSYLSSMIVRRARSAPVTIMPRG